jgi:hypothetical protein
LPIRIWFGFHNSDCSATGNVNHRLKCKIFKYTVLINKTSREIVGVVRREAVAIEGDNSNCSADAGPKLQMQEIKR